MKMRRVPSRTPGTLVRRVSPILGLTLVLLSCHADLLTSWTDIEQEFANPPASAKPWVHWMWVDGNISAEGITADLEAMARVGIGGFVLMDFTQEVPRGPVEFDTPRWHSLFKHAVNEAARLGLQVSLNNCPGWTGSGGPWITPELSMQKLVSAHTNLTGPTLATLQLPRLPSYHGYVRDVATLAFPFLPETTITPGRGRKDGEVVGSGRPVLLENFQAKSGLARHVPSGSAPANYSPGNIIALDKIIDLSALVTTEGLLSWNVPPGNWTVLRLGRMPTGRENPPARAGGLGLECDKLSKDAVDVHFAGFMAMLLSEVGPAGSNTICSTHADSWERGFQNWTPHFREEFQRRRGYDPLKYLPAMTGRIVVSVEITERFLWDIRRTIADLFADNYAGHLAELAHQHGLQLSLEAYGNGPFDDLLYASRADVPMSEVWNETDDYSKLHTSRAMASAAHTYGKPVVAAEAFTAWPVNGKWQNHPASLKWLADAAFAEGVNRLVIHRFVHQPWLDRIPGLTMGMWGVHYDRTETWWEQSGAWHRYLARCQFLLQQGHYAADVCYMTGEGAFTEAPTREQLQPPVPDGYDYDICTPEVVLRRMSVCKDSLGSPFGLGLSDGVFYRVLVIPPVAAATPALLQQLRQLIQAGATVVANRKPEGSPSLSGYPECDSTVRSLAHELWGQENETAPFEKKIGAGRLIQGKNLDEILGAMHVPPDFSQLSGTPRPLRHIHRRLNGGDVYFVANPNTNPVTVECAFRVTGRQPELWQPDTGEIRRVGCWRTNATATLVPLRLDSIGSLFVVFRHAPRAAPVTSLTCDGQAVAFPEIWLNDSNELVLSASASGAYRATTGSGNFFSAKIGALPAPSPLTNSWRVSFPQVPPKREAPAPPPLEVTLTNLISWTAHPLPAVRYFSGVAIYRTCFEVQSGNFSSRQRIYLDLGKVYVLASISVNDQPVATLWKPPFIADISAQCRAGTNSLEAHVANLWPNRLIGDDFLPEDCAWTSLDPGQNGAALVNWPDWFLEGKPSPTGRTTFTTRRFWTRESPLLPSGLLGPVTIQFRKEAVFGSEG